jgi:hypothetical protein
MNKQQIGNILKFYNHSHCFFNFDWDEIEDFFYDSFLFKEGVIFWKPLNNRLFFISESLEALLVSLKKIPLESYSLCLENISESQSGFIKESGLNFKKYLKFSTNSLPIKTLPIETTFAVEVDLLELSQLLKKYFPHSYEPYEKDWIRQRIHSKEILVKKDLNKITSLCIFKINQDIYEGYYTLSTKKDSNPFNLLLESFSLADKRGACKGLCFIEERDTTSIKMHKLLKFQAQDLAMYGIWK